MLKWGLEEEGRGCGGGVEERTVNVFGPYFGGGVPMSRRETEKKALELTVVSEGWS